MPATSPPVLARPRSFRIPAARIKGQPIDLILNPRGYLELCPARRKRWVRISLQEVFWRALRNQICQDSHRYQSHLVNSKQPKPPPRPSPGPLKPVKPIGR
jgi:hypothetical protein